MSIVRFPCYHVTDPRAGLTVHIEAKRYKRVIRFDSTLGLIRIVREDATERFTVPAKVLPFWRRA